MKFCNFKVDYTINPSSIPIDIGVAKKLQDMYKKFTFSVNSAAIEASTEKDSDTMKEMTSADNMKFDIEFCLNEINEYAAMLHLLKTYQTIDVIKINLYNEDDDTLLGSIVYTNVSVKNISGLTMSFNRYENVCYKVGFMASAMRIVDPKGKELTILHNLMPKARTLLNE
jgi:hypothetical protein